MITQNGEANRDLLLSVTNSVCVCGWVGGGGGGQSGPTPLKPLKH